MGRASLLFVAPPGDATASFVEPIGTAFLRAVLAREGIGARQYLPAASPTLCAFASFLAEQRPEVVGFTAYESNLRACRAMIRTVREALPEAVVLVGGPNATFTPEETLALLEADLCVRGAAEAVVVPVAKAILGSMAPRRRLAGLVAGTHNLVGRAEGGNWATAHGDLSSIPGPPYRSLDDLPSPYQDGLLASADAGLLTSRGCNQHCTYCSFAAISGHRVRYHSVERVLDDVAALKSLAERRARRQRVISVLDDAFTLSPRRARAICEGIIRRRLELPFECLTRADRVDQELLRLMRRAGFVQIGFGLESAVPRVLRAIGKVQPPGTAGDPAFEAERDFLERMRRAVDAARAEGLSPTVSIIGGLPGETAEDLRTTLAFVESLGVRSYTHNLLMALPGTPLHRDRARHGIRTERCSVTKTWQTDLAYDARQVSPLPTADLHQALWDEAAQIADALCGRPRHGAGAQGGAWAVVLHGGEPRPRVGQWLRQVLAVNGTVVSMDHGTQADDGAWMAWLGLLQEAGVPWGLAVCLVPTVPDSTGSKTLRTKGGQGTHRFEIESGPEPTGRFPAVDDAGNWRVPIWIASAACDAPPARAQRQTVAPGTQIADGCRWRRTGRRCADPRVLHVAADGAVRACWRGPVIGRVGDPFGALAASGRSLRWAGRGSTEACPMGPVADGAARGAGAQDVVARLSWLLHGASQARGR